MYGERKARAAWMRSGKALKIQQPFSRDILVDSSLFDPGRPQVAHIDKLAGRRVRLGQLLVFVHERDVSRKRRRIELRMGSEDVLVGIIIGVENLLGGRPIR